MAQKKKSKQLVLKIRCTMGEIACLKLSMQRIGNSCTVERHCGVSKMFYVHSYLLNTSIKRLGT